MTEFHLFEEVRTLRLPLPPDTKNALLAQGIEPPDGVTLLLRQATPRETEQLAAVNNSPPKTGPAATAWMVNLLMRRAVQGTDERVVRELVKDMTPSAITIFMFAYTEGRMPDPKERERVLTATMTEIRRLGQPNAASSPAPARSSHTSTASTRKGSKTSRRTTSTT